MAACAGVKHARTLAAVPSLSPVLSAVLLAVVAIAATQIGAVRRLVRAAHSVPLTAPLTWYLLGVTLGPLLGVVDRAVLEAATPALVLAAAWIAARAGVQAAARTDPAPRSRVAPWAGALATWGLPALTLYAIMRWLPASFAPAWEPRLPVIAVLAAAMTVAVGTERRAGLLVAIVAVLAALADSLPHGRLLRLPRHAVWAAGVVGGTALTIVLWGWIGRRVVVPLRGVVVGLALGAGLGLASRASPFVVCATAAAELSRRFRGGEGIGESLLRSEGPAGAILWVAAGALLGGAPATLAVAALALVVGPMGIRLLARRHAGIDSTLGLAFVLSYVWTTGRGNSEPLVTATAAALLVAASVPVGRAPHLTPLTSGLGRVEVSA